MVECKEKDFKWKKIDSKNGSAKRLIISLVILGGEIIAEGKPEEIAKIDVSYTGKFLKPLLDTKYKKIA